MRKRLALPTVDIEFDTRTVASGTARDRLAYMAELLTELRDMALDAGCGKLARLLAEADAEARRQLGDDAH